MSFGSSNYLVQEHPIGDTTIGYILRWKNTQKWKQSTECHHSEFILPRGEIVAYGYEPGEVIAQGTCYQRTLEKGADGIIRSSDPNAERKIPAAFLDYQKSIKLGFRSSVLLIQVHKFQANQIEMFWRNMSRKYNKYFHNCSTACYFAFREIDLIPRLFPEVVSPERLFHHLTKHLKNQTHYKWIEEHGFIGLSSSVRTLDKISLVVAKEKGSGH